MTDPAARLHLQGQDSDEAKALVVAQRDIKKKKDAIRKLSSKLKNASNEEDKEKVKAEIAAAEGDIAALEKILAPVGKVQPAAEAAPAAPAAVPSCQPTSAETCTAALQGQGTEEARDVVQAQRDLKKKKDSIRKLSSKLKASTDEAEKQLLKDQISAAEAEIAALPAPTVPAAPSMNRVNVALGSHSNVPAALAGIVSTPVEQSVPSLPMATPSNSSLTTPLATPGRKSAGTSALVFKPHQTQLSPTIANGDGKIVEPPPYALLVHPRMAEAGLLMQNMQLVGGNARTIAFLNALIEVARATPVLDAPAYTNKERRDFEKIVNENFKFLQNCREPCAGMTYAKRAVVRRLTSMITTSVAAAASPTACGGAAMAMPERNLSASSINDAPASPVTCHAPSAFHSRSLPASSARFHLENITVDEQNEDNEEAKGRDGFLGVRDFVIASINDIREEIFRSIHSLVEERGQPHIASGDCILTFGRSSSVEFVLQHAVSLNKKFRVIVVDSGPLFEGKGFAARLQRLGVEVSYGLITSVCTLLPRCTKVFIGASAVLQSGEVYSRAGTGTVAAAAKCFRKPVICMCESHKFVPKVWIGSLVQNSEVGDLLQRRPMGLQSQNIPVCPENTTPPALAHMNTNGYLYDLTPAMYVDMVVCEMGCLHTSAIAAAIRDRQDREVLMMQA